jgi:hypothetical protein
MLFPWMACGSVAPSGSGGGYMKAVFKLPEAFLHGEHREKIRT